jgi:hypothetical protein
MLPPLGHSPGGKSVDAASSVCVPRSAMRLRSTVSVLSRARHEVGDLGAAVAELGARAAGLHDRDTDAEVRDLLGDRLHEPFDAPLRSWYSELPGKATWPPYEDI